MAETYAEMKSRARAAHEAIKNASKLRCMSEHHYANRYDARWEDRLIESDSLHGVIESDGDHEIW